MRDKDTRPAKNNAGRNPSSSLTQRDMEFGRYFLPTCAICLFVIWLLGAVMA